jgi:hypothetical protein
VPGLPVGGVAADGDDGIGGQASDEAGHGNGDPEDHAIDALNHHSVRVSGLCRGRKSTVDDGNEAS